MSGKPVHGGRLDEAVEKHGGARDRWLDLSTGINPKPYPVPDIPADAWSVLPDTAAADTVREAMRAAYGTGAAISLAGGSQQHIQMLPRLFKPQDVAIVGFTYQEHATCWRREGHAVFVTDGLESAEATARIVIVVNPNNPDGTVYSRDTLLALSRRLAARGGALIVDEAFAEVTPRASLAGDAGRDGLVVLRSFGKFYGLAGARLGAMLSSATLCEAADVLLGPWAVAGPTLHVATDALTNKAWAQRTRKRLSRDRERLEEMLSDAGMTVIGGTDLFVLATSRDAEAIAERLAKAYILVRAFPEQSQWLRFGLPGGKAAFTRLRKALAARGPSA